MKQWLNNVAMSECNEYIESIYRHPRIAEFIGSIQPDDLQNDLRQEMAIVLLNYDCLKIAGMHMRGELVQFAMGILWKMGRLQKGEFYKIFKKKYTELSEEYLTRTSSDPNAVEMAVIARRKLRQKLMSDANDAHESMIFSKYVELGTCRAVAEYFGIPKHHVDKVVSKCRKELKQAIKKQI